MTILIVGSESKSIVYKCKIASFIANNSVSKIIDKINLSKEVSRSSEKINSLEKFVIDVYILF